MRDNLFGIIIGVIVVAVLGVAIVVGGGDDNNSISDGDGQDILEISQLDYVKGLEGGDLVPTPKVTVFEYGDFQCPFCAAVHPVVNQVSEEYINNPDVVFVFRHFPITAAHPNAMVAHRAAEAAGKQNSFYAMQDLLFENQSAIAESSDPDGLVRGLAEQLELDIDQYDADFANSETLSVINQQLQGAESIGVTSTPTFYVNETQLEQAPRTADELRAAIENELEKVNSAESSGEAIEAQ